MSDKTDVQTYVKLNALDT